MYTFTEVGAVSCRGGGVTHHSILSYQERLYRYLEQLALQSTSTAAATLPSGQRATSREAEDAASLFRQAPRQGCGDNPLLDEVGRFAGTHLFIPVFSAVGLSGYMILAIACRNRLWHMQEWQNVIGKAG